MSQETQKEVRKAAVTYGLILTTMGTVLGIALSWKMLDLPVPAFSTDLRALEIVVDNRISQMSKELGQRMEVQAAFEHGTRALVVKMQLTALEKELLAIAAEVARTDDPDIRRRLTIESNRLRNDIEEYREEWRQIDQTLSSASLPSTE